MDRAEAITYWEGLHKTFSGQIEKEENHFGRMHLQYTLDVLDTTIAALREQEQSKWISVKERLPEENTTVIVSEDNGIVFQCLLGRRCGGMMKKIPCPVCEGKGFTTWTNTTETSCGTGSKTCPHCQGTGQREVPMTNADRIRVMTDEELADMRVRYDPTRDMYISDRGAHYDFVSAMEEELEWLQQPAGGADHE